MTIIYFVLIFGLVVVAHEFGHFLLAKANGIHVVEFAVGMGPKLLHFKKGETEYCLRLLPIGGACMFENEDELGGSNGRTYEEGSFPAANVWARISTVVAGPLFNFILGFLLALIIVWFSGSDRPGAVAPGGAGVSAGTGQCGKICRAAGAGGTRAAGSVWRSVCPGLL